MEDPLRTTRHNLRGRVNSLKLCVSALAILESKQERLEFLAMIDQSVEQTLAALTEFEAAQDAVGPGTA